MVYKNQSRSNHDFTLGSAHDHFSKRSFVYTRGISLIQVAVDVIQGLLACSVSTLATTSFAAKARRLRPAVGRPAKLNSPATELFTYGRLRPLGCRRGHATQ